MPNKNKTMNRVGEEILNNFGSKMKIIRFNGVKDIDVYFEKYDWVAKNKQYNAFKSGKIKCPYEPRVFGVGYLGEGKHKAYENGKHTKCYDRWKSMLIRCYDEKHHKKYPTYIGCEVCDEWLNFQNFAKWYYNNYYEVDGEKMALDKDILIKKNKIYSPQTCVFVPNRINNLFVKCNKSRGNICIGVSLYDNEKYVAFCSNHRTINLGTYYTQNEAFQAYKQFKEKYIKKVADEYKDKIPQKLYEAMYNYEVEITD